MLCKKKPVRALAVRPTWPFVNVKASSIPEPVVREALQPLTPIPKSSKLGYSHTQTHTCGARGVWDYRRASRSHPKICQVGWIFQLREIWESLVAVTHTLLIPLVLAAVRHPAAAAFAAATWHLPSKWPCSPCSPRTAIRLRMPACLIPRGARCRAVQPLPHNQLRPRSVRCCAASQPHQVFNLEESE